jgi:hypothetical protein
VKAERDDDGAPLRGVIVGLALVLPVWALVILFVL